MVRIAIIGAGNMGNVHALSCQQLPGVSVTWVADQDGARSAALAASFGARATTASAEALAADDVDAAIIALPTPYHREATELAASHGKHVFCEKPIARTAADARAMVESCERAGVRLMIGHVVRFFPEYARIYELLQENAIGQVGVVRASRLNTYPTTDRNWYADVALSGGPIVDLMIHDLDTLRWYFGEIERVYARGLTYSGHQPVTDYTLALVRFASGVVAHVETSWAHTSFRTAIEVTGSEGVLRHNSEQSAALRLERPGKEQPLTGVQLPRGPLAEGPYQRELRHFITQLHSGEPFMTDGEEGIRSLEAALAVLQAVRTRQPVSFTAGRPELQEDAK